MRPVLDDLIATVAALPVQPVAFEAFWDGDTSGWFLDLFAIVPQADGYQTIILCCLQDGGDIRIFNGQVPPWSEAEEAGRLGQALATQFSVPFYFPSPDHPDYSCPHWWEQSQGIPCRRCGIPLLQAASCRWPGICSYCHGDEQREQREATWTPEERAGPRCQICGNPAPTAPTVSDTHRLCPSGQDRYHDYRCRRCDGAVLELRTRRDTKDEICSRCVIEERLAAVPDDQRQRIRDMRATKGEFAAVDLALELLGWSVDQAFDAVWFLQRTPDPLPDDLQT